MEPISTFLIIRKGNIKSHRPSKGYLYCVVVVALSIDLKDSSLMHQLIRQQVSFAVVVKKMPLDQMLFYEKM
jgi:hypothetical protein